MAASQVKVKFDWKDVVSSASYEIATSKIKKLKASKNGEITNLDEWASGIVSAAEQLGATYLFQEPSSTAVEDGDRDVARAQFNAQHGVSKVKVEKFGKIGTDSLSGEERAALEKLVSATMAENHASDAASDALELDIHNVKMGYFVDTSLALVEPMSLDEEEYKKYVKNKDLMERVFGHFYKVEMPWRGKVKGRGVPYWAPLEDRKKQQLRQLVYLLLEKSLQPVLKKALWKDNLIGDCYWLHQMVVRRFGKNRKKERLNLVLRRVEELKQLGDARNVDEWFMRVRVVVSDAQSVGLTLDEHQVRSNMQQAVTASDVGALQKAWTEAEKEEEKVRVREGMEWSFATFLDTVRANYVAECGNGGLKVKKKGGGGDEEVSVFLADKGGSGGGGGAPPHKPIGICLDYQDNKCKRGKACRFKHIRLKGKQLELLRAHIRGKRERKQQAGGSEGFVPMSERTCYGCGKTGHIRSACPEQGQGQRAEGAGVQGQIALLASDSEQVKGGQDDMAQLFSAFVAFAAQHKGAVPQVLRK